MTPPTKHQHEPPGACDYDNPGTPENNDINATTTTMTTTTSVPPDSKKSSSLAFTLIFLLNLAAAAYIASRQSRHTMMQMRWEVQVQMLRNKVKSDDIEINILRHRMDTLEELLMEV